jgi:hypothetical protein
MTRTRRRPSPSDGVTQPLPPSGGAARRAPGGWEGLGELPRVVLHSIVGAYVLAGIALSLALAKRPLAGLEDYAFQLVLASAIYPLGYGAALRLTPPARLLPARDAYRLVARTVWRELLEPRRLLDFLLPGSVMAVVLASFTSWKLAIPSVSGFGWDETLARWDAALHFGRHPWAWLQPIVGRAWATRLIDLIYFSLWFPLVLGVFTWQAWRPPSPHRSRFAATMLGTIIFVGTLAATVFASVGPQFYAKVTEGPDPYAPLLQHLDAISRDTPLWATRVREWLWTVHEQDAAVAAAGISAMPSVHVALAELCAIVGRRHGRFMGSLTTAFSVLTLVGSIHLGPHYAIDGYVSILIVHALWWLTGRLVGAVTEPGLLAGRLVPGRGEERSCTERG